MPYLPATDRDLDAEDVDLVMPSSAATDFVARSTAFLRINDRIKEMETQKKALRDELMQFIADYEYEANGSQALELPEPVNGVVALVRQRKVRKMPIDEQAAERILKDKDIYDRCTVEVRELDGDQIMAAMYEGLLSEDELLEILPLKEEYSLVPKKK